MAKPQLTKGGRELSERLLTELAKIRRLATEMSLADVKLLPMNVMDVHAEIVDAAARIQKLITDDLEKMLQRQATNGGATDIAERLAQVEQQLAEMQRRPNVVAFPRRKRG